MMLLRYAVHEYALVGVAVALVVAIGVIVALV
jgi:hypothetical protein